MKIEIALPTLEVGGMEQMVITLSLALARHGHDVGVTCLNELGELADRLHGTSVRLSLVRAPGFRASFSAPALEQHFRALRPDVVHTHSGAWGRACRAARKAGVPVIVHTVHGKLDRDPWYDVPLKRWEARHSDAVVAVSSALALDLIKRVGLESRTISTLINGVDTSRFRPSPAERACARRTLGLDDRFVIGTVARLVHIKNHAALLTAFSRIAWQRPDAVLVVAGDGPLEHALNAQAAALGLGDRVRFLGSIPDTERIYRALDLFVLPSFAEGTSLSVLEAMASGVPVVATAVGGTPALLDNGACGLLATSPDPVAVELALSRALADPATMQRFAQRALERVERDYSLEAMVTAYESLYEQLLRQSARA
ncbi:MAG: glycosyltransferase [Gemmatimonadaceae bacterium]|nr:glycosyltransferase [Gemmatimonadaceae bacterium]